MNSQFIRLLDIAVALFGLVCCLPLLLFLIAIGLHGGSPLFLQKRVGHRQRPFTIVKFRTMKVGTISAASHLVCESSITTFGHFLRRTKLDELPQLWNVLIGDMSVVGPRPCLFNQTELITEREKRGVFCVRPGITGQAQTNGIDMSQPRLLAETDAQMIRSFTIRAYFYFILKTVIGSCFLAPKR